MIPKKNETLRLAGLRAEVFTWWNLRPWLGVEKVNERFLSVGRDAVNRVLLKQWRAEWEELRGRR